MPTYEYECTRCGHICEEFKPISAPKRQRCPKCRSRVERLISGGLGVHFKGAGFYVNDSRGKKGAGKTDSGASTSGSGDKSASSKAEKTSGSKGTAD